MQYTYNLCRQVTSDSELYVLTLQDLAHLVPEQLPHLPVRQLICVPERRNTLPHTIFALNTIADMPDEPILFTTVDHLITQEDVYVASIRQLIQDTHDLRAVTLVGNRSSVHDPNAGYFVIDENHKILRFKEKPGEQDMAALAQSGKEVLKDTAMFLASKTTFDAALATFPGEVSSPGRALLAASAKERTDRFLAMPFVDIATGFYEQAANIRAVLSDGDFIDLGSFGSLYKTGTKDAQGNVITGNVVVDAASRGNYIFNQTDAPLVVINTSDSVIVQTGHGTVVAPNSDVNTVGEIYKSKIHAKR